MTSSHFLPDDTGSTERPTVVATLCIATFLNTGLFILGYGFSIIAMLMVREMPVDEFVTLLVDGATKYMPDAETAPFEQLALILHEHGVVLMFIYLLRTIVRLVGAIGIWQGRKSGFHLYAAAQLVGLFLPHIFLPWAYLGIGGPLMTVGITAAYGSQLKRLR